MEHYVGVVLGVINGTVYKLLKIPCLIVSLGLLLIYEILAQKIGLGVSKTIPADVGIIGKFPYSLIILGASALLFYYIYNKTCIACHIRAVKYEFNTTDEHGNKIIDKMSREETLQAMKDIGSQYGDAVIVEFSGDGMAALVENKKGIVDANVTQEQRESMEARNAAFQKEITQDDNSLELPAYSGMYGADKAVASAVENCSKEEQGFVYDIIRQNFLVGNTGSMTEEERQANISLGMKKAEYAAENFIPEDSRKSFLEAMESIAKLASAGKADNNGNMDYGVGKGTYLGHGSNLVKTTNALDMMRTMDGSAYTEYQKISKESSNEDRQLNALKYLTNWYEGAVKKNPSMVDNYEKQSDRKSTRLNSSHMSESRMPSSA